MSPLFFCFLVALCNHASATPPKFSTTMQQVMTLPEFPTSSSQKLVDVDCTDDDGDQVIVSLTTLPASYPCRYCFQVYSNCGSQATGPKYCLQYQGTEAFVIKTQAVYTLTMTCRDVTGESAVLPYSLYLVIIPNTKPVITYQQYIEVTNTRNIGAGDAVYTVNCTDSDSDPLTYTLTTSSASSFFTIDNSGVIRALKDLNGMCITSTTFAVTCQDTRHPAVGPRSIYVLFKDTDAQPAIRDLSPSVDVPENTGIGDAVTTFNVAGVVTSCAFTTTQQYFEVAVAGNVGTISVKADLNYEQSPTQSTNLVMTCTNGFCTSSPAAVYVTVTDVNEPVTITPKTVTETVYEGQISVNTPWQLADEDANERHTYSIVSGNDDGRFFISPTSGVIASTGAYDVDGGAMPATVTLGIEVTDKGGNVDTATVDLTIEDSNDNRPVFGSTALLTLTTSDCPAGLGQDIHSLPAATDADSMFQGNNVITYSASSGPILVSDAGVISTPSSGLVGGNSYFLEVTAQDAGVHPFPLTSLPKVPVNVVVTLCPTPSPAPTTPAPTTAAPTTTTPASTIPATGTTTMAMSTTALETTTASVTTAAVVVTPTPRNGVPRLGDVHSVGRVFLLAVLGFLIQHY